LSFQTSEWYLRSRGTATLCVWLRWTFSKLPKSNSTDITLAVVTLKGVSAGSIGAQLTIMQIDDDEGNPLPISVSSGTVSVY